MRKVILGYEERFREKVVQEVLQGELTLAEASRKYKIRGHVTISRWIKKYRNYGGIDKRGTAEMKKPWKENTPEGKLAAAERQIELYKQLIERSEYFKDPAVKKKIAERLLNTYGENIEELEELDIPWLKSVLYTALADRRTIRQSGGTSDEPSKNEESLSESKACEE